MSKGWIAVDLDGTLAHYDGWKGVAHIGEPVPAMLKRVIAWIDKGLDVRIFTARVSEPEALGPIMEWSIKHLGAALPITNVKDFAMIELWDDRCVQVIANTGEPVGVSTRGLL